MRTLALTLFLLAAASAAEAQSLKFYYSGKGAKVVGQSGDTLYDPWSGGFLNAQFSNIDLDGNGKQDLFVFEPEDGSVLTFIDEGFGNWAYAPEYAAAFPPMERFALLVDYNKDGKADIFTFSSLGAGMDVYQNISQGNKPAFKLIAKQLSYEDIDFRSNIYVPSSDIPSIADVDNDGDIDILAYNVTQTRVTWYRNRSAEKYGKPDSLDFRIADFCWGKFEEPLDTINPVVLGIECGKVKKRADKHAGATTLAFDADGDGDLDFVTGDLGKSYLAFLENGRIKNGNPFTESDSMIRFETNFPSNTTPVSVSVYPAAFLADVNADGRKDLLVTPQAMGESRKENNVLLYLNKGNNSKPVFEFKQVDYLQNQTIFFGSYSAVCFWDYDGDGLTDMLVAGKGNPQRVYLYGKLTLYRNVGSATKPVFKKTADDFAGLGAKNIAFLTPATGDMDGDGKADLVLGQEDGKLLFYKNTGLSGGLPQMVLQSDAFAGIDVGDYSVPSIADINRDALKDLVIGELSGTINYYKNTGSTSAPSFTLENDYFGRVRTNHFFYTYDYDTAGKPIDSTLQMESNGYSAPHVTDLDGDGKWDMLAGTAQGGLMTFMDIESHLQDSFTEAGPVVYNTVYDKYVRPDFGFISIPAAADLDGDTRPEVIVGNYRGGLYYLSSKYIPLGVGERVNPKRNPGFKIYPNPANDFIVIESKEKYASLKGKIVVYNSLGQDIYTNTTALFPLRINVRKWPAGVYYLEYSDKDGVEALPLMVR
jgi:hypothetical protein